MPVVEIETTIISGVKLFKIITHMLYKGIRILGPGYLGNSVNYVPFDRIFKTNYKQLIEDKYFWL
jgi:hypothetical protein